METEFIRIAGLIGDATRATILWTLLDGKAFTATELALAAGTSAPNTSMHLAKLVQAGLLNVESQGRHRYYRFAKKEIAYAIEAMASLVPPASAGRGMPPDKNPAIRYCRSCYDHLAGQLGVSVTESLLQQKIIVADGKKYDVTPKGTKWFTRLGVDTSELKNKKRSFLRPCLDWSERRDHMAGAVAAALLDMMLSADWIRRTPHSRVLTVTGKGRRMMNEHFGMEL